MEHSHRNCTDSGRTTVFEDNFINLSVTHKVEVTIISKNGPVSMVSPAALVVLPHVRMDVSMSRI